MRKAGEARTDGYRGLTAAVLEVRPSQIDGKGIFACARIGGRRKFGELTGELVGLREARRRAAKRRRIAIVELPAGGAIDAAVGGNEFRFINHSCSPNAYMRIFDRRVEFYALRDIEPGEEITCDYGETQHDGTLRCRCGRPGCRGYL